jgi:hypothetical protein
MSPELAPNEAEPANEGEPAPAAVSLAQPEDLNRPLSRRERQRLRARRDKRPRGKEAARPLRKVIVYIRVSWLAGRDVNSPATHTLRTQLGECESLAKRNGWEIVDVVRHLDVSGSRTDTEERLQDILKRIEAGEADGLVVYRAARFTRNQEGSIRVTRRLLKLGAHLKATDVEVDIHTAAGKLLLDIMVSVAEAEADAISANWYAIHESNVKQAGRCARASAT